LYLLVNEGLSFWLLGLTGGFAIFLGDIVFFYLGKNGYKFLESSEAGWAISFKDWIDKRSLRGLKLFTYFYVGLTPMPNDLITLALGASKYRFRDFLIPLFIGSIQLQTLTAYLFSLGLLSSLNN